MISETDFVIEQYKKNHELDDAPLYLLDDAFVIVWRNNAALELLPETYWRDLLNECGCFSDAEYIVNDSRYYTFDQTIDSRLVRIFRLDIPSKRQYYRLTLLDKSSKVQCLDSIPQQSYASYNNALAASQNISSLMLTIHDFESGTFYHETHAIDALAFLRTLLEKVANLLSLNGVDIIYRLYCVGNIITQPDGLVEIISCLINHFLTCCEPGEETVPIEVKHQAQWLIVSIGEISPHTQEDISKDQLQDMTWCQELPIQVAEKTATWMGGRLTASEINGFPVFKVFLPWREAPRNEIVQCFHGVQILQQRLSGLLNSDSSCSCSISNDFSDIHAWSLFHDMPLWGRVDKFVDSLYAKAGQLDYSNFYGNQFRRNLARLNEFGFPHSDMERAMLAVSEEEYILLYGIQSEEELKKPLSAEDSESEPDPYLVPDKKVPSEVSEEVINKFLSFYGVTRAQMDTPNFLLNVITGNVSQELLQFDSVSMIGLLVLTALNKNPHFKTENTAFNACAEIQLRPESSGPSIEELFEAGKELVTKHFFDPSQPIYDRIAANLALFRCFSGFTLPEAARFAGIHPHKLKAMEVGDFSNSYCRELERLRLLYNVDIPDGLFIGGFAFVYLWRRNPLKFMSPLATYKNSTDPTLGEISHVASPYYDLVDGETEPRAIIVSRSSNDGTNEPICSNMAARSFLISKPSYPPFNIFLMKIILCIDGHQLQVTSPIDSIGTVYVFRLTRAGDANILLLSFEVGGSKVNVDMLNYVIKIIREEAAVPHKLNDFTYNYYKDRYPIPPVYHSPDGKAYKYEDLKFYIGCCYMNTSEAGFIPLVFAVGLCIEKPDLLNSEDKLIEAIVDEMIKHRDTFPSWRDINPLAVSDAIEQLIEAAWFRYICSDEDHAPPCQIPMTVIIERIIMTYIKGSGARTYKDEIWADIDL